jgi:D-sedoheptulose 7-phosphate isomerase
MSEAPTTHLEGALQDAAQTLSAFMTDGEQMAAVLRFAQEAEATLRRGGTLLSCGNGGSMCDAMHFAEEWTGRFRGDRAAQPAIAFSDPARLSCAANDLGYEEAFAREVQAYGKEGDLLLAISTSGNSPNILRACEEARERGLVVVGLLGNGGGKMASKVDIPIVVPVASTSDRIQEMHIKIIHMTIELVERQMFPENYA